MNEATIPEAFLSTHHALLNLKLCLAASFAIYFVSLPFLKGKFSYFDVGAAQRILIIIRTLVFFEICSLFILLYFVMSLGNPLKLHALTNYGKNENWIYGYGRPVTGIATIILGVFADMHIFNRVICLLGCLHQVSTDAISAFQLLNYIDEVNENGAPKGRYAGNLLEVYCWRDMISISLSMLLCLYMCHFTTVVGWGLKPYIPYKVIAGGEQDRCEVMRTQRKSRKHGEMLKGEEEIDRSLRREQRKLIQREEFSRNHAIDAEILEEFQQCFGDKDENVANI